MFSSLFLSSLSLECYIIICREKKCTYISSNNFFFIFILFTYIKMSKDSSAKYKTTKLQKKERLQKKP